MLNRIKMEEEKVKGVLNWPTSKGIKNIQKFLGLANYYWQFIKDFVFIAKPLYNLVKKNQKWDWMEKQEIAFKELKKRFTKQLVLVVPDLDKKIRIKVNVSEYTIRVVLFIKCKDGQQKPVAYLSKIFNETERSYEIHDKEMLAVIRRLENQRYLLKNVKFKFKVQIDYKNLEYFMKVQKLNHR